LSPPWPVFSNVYERWSFAAALMASCGDKTLRQDEWVFEPSGQRPRREPRKLLMLNAAPCF